MLLAKAGLEVTILEKRGVVGGRTSTMELDGFRFDVGPTFFLFPQVLREIFAATACVWRGREGRCDLPCGADEAGDCRDQPCRCSAA
jgi:predicted NAD/FAD-dependent oxidoreductase